MKAELLNYFGDDLMITNAARVSYGKSKNVFDEKDGKLINFLVEHKHVAPFRHPQLQFRIQCPIFVERQLFKHQVGMSANSISGRYVDFSDNYFVIEKLRKQSKSSKQGSEGEIDSPELLEKISNFVQQSSSLYKELCDAGVAKEQARMILPFGFFTEFWATCNLRSFMHWYIARTDAHAQWEIQELAKAAMELIKDQYPETIQAILNKGGNK